MKWGENSFDEMGSLILNVVPRQQMDSTTLRSRVVSYSIAQAPFVGNKPFFISAGIVDGASARASPVTPGKVTVLYGDNLGPTNLANGQVSSGKVSSSAGGTQVLFDVVPAPVLYSSAGQVAVIAPYSLDGKSGTQVVVKNGTTTSDPVALPVTPVAPSIFSSDTSGTGQGVILNFDFTVNSAAKPADKGSVIILYATGEGQTNPGGIDGQIANGPSYPVPVAKPAATVNIGGLPAEVLYAGAAPQLVAGVMQLNVRIPAGVASGDVPVEVLIGGAKSQPGITVAVK